MASLLESFEQQYGTLSAEITARTGQISILTGAEKKTAVHDVEKLLEEAGELLEQMELEARDVPEKDREKYQNRTKSYQAELKRLEKEYNRAKINYGDSPRSRDELLNYDDSNESEDQRKRLLDNTERLERSGRRLETGYAMAVATEGIGAQVIEDLQSQRETIKRTRDRLREADTELGRSSRVLTGMLQRVVQNRVLLILIGLVILSVIVMSIYFTTRRKNS